MPSMRWVVAGALLALGAAPVAGQHMRMGAPGQQGGMMDQGMMQMCHAMMGGAGAMQGQSMMGGDGMMGLMQDMGPSPAALVGAADHLGLTPDQVSRLEALAMSSGESHHAHMDAAMAARQEAAGALGAESADLDAYERELKNAADHMVQAHMAMVRAGLDASAVLTPEQRAELHSGMALMGSMACGMMSEQGKMKGGGGSGGEHAQPHR
ncbi:MAG: Spy/CpxP family protein refolding chaperone [Longimicrobiales bacterium]|nr:Spy/CpxP family protein refolding chaperone [Longimicrobiales bacterium]